MIRLTLGQSVEFLNINCGYVDVENDGDYTEKEIIRLAEIKLNEVRI